MIEKPEILERPVLKNKKGITLIALVITIIVLLILAGVTIGMLTGENGILKNAQKSAEQYSEEAAREKLEVKLAEMQTEKIINKEEYNENEYLTEQLSKAGFGVSGNIVMVDGWQFQIDRSVPKIELSLGKGKINEEMKIELSQEVAEDYTKSIVTIKVTSAEEIKSIIVNGEEITNISEENGVYTITREITENKTYSILVKDKNENYNMNTIAITELAENMEIWNKEDLVAFREKVNSGATFEGRTVRVMADININEKKYTVEEGEVTFEPDAEQWIPIANYGEDNTLKFKGTLEGNNHKIKGLYIENEKDYQGLFGYNEGTIQNLTIEEGYIKGTGYIGGITGANYGNINTCNNSVAITCAGSGTYLYIGGIAGVNYGYINSCNNEGTIVNTGYASAGVAARRYFG